MKRHTNLINEIEMNKPKDHNNLYVGIAAGVMVTLCGMIYVGVSYLEAVMY
jgi:hypothetical protein